MFEREQIILNGEFVSGESVNFYLKNRAFLYGDSIFETIRVINSKFLFFDEHIERLYAGMKVLKYELFDNIFEFKKKLEEDVLKLIDKKSCKDSSRVRISVYRRTGGFYTPNTNLINYVISCSKIKDKKFVLNTYGLNIGIYKDVRKPINVFSPFKTANSILFTLAGIYSKENKFEDCLILNESDNIVESVSSNVFIVKGEKLYTPPIKSGCISGIMRSVIFSIAKSNSIVCVEKTINENDLLNSDEVFLTNSITGIQWVVAYKSKRFYKKKATFLINLLNETVI